MPCAGEGGEPAGRGAGALEPQHLVGQPLDEIATGRVGDEPAETLLTAAFGPGRRRLGCPQQRVGDLDRSCDHAPPSSTTSSWRARCDTRDDDQWTGPDDRRAEPTHGRCPVGLRFYEDSGLIHAERTSGGQRRYRRDVIRRVSFIRVAQQIGLGLGEIGAYMSELPDRRTPDRTDWERVATRGGRGSMTRSPCSSGSANGSPAASAAAACRSTCVRSSTRPINWPAKDPARADCSTTDTAATAALPTTGAPARRAASACGKRRRRVAGGAPVVAAGRSVAAEPSGPERGVGGNAHMSSLSRLDVPVSHRPVDRISTQPKG